MYTFQEYFNFSFLPQERRFSTDALSTSQFDGVSVQWTIGISQRSCFLQSRFTFSEFKIEKRQFSLRYLKAQFYSYRK